MTFETTIPLYIVVAGVASFLITLFNKNNKEYEENRHKFYKIILFPYFNLHLKENDSDKKLFFNNHIMGLHKDYIPPYIYYLVNNYTIEEIDKVLLVDYLNNYPSHQNSINRTRNKVMDSANTILYFSYFLMIFLLLVLVTIFIPLIISEFYNFIVGNPIITTTVFNLKLPNILFLLLILIIMFCIIKFFFSSFTKSLSKNDIYTYDSNAIHYLIESRIKKYDKLVENNILFQSNDE